MKPKRLKVAALLLVLAAGTSAAGAERAESGDGRQCGDRQYDIFHQVRLAAFADLIIESINQEAEKDLAQPRPDEHPADYEIRQRFTRAVVRSLTRTLRELYDVQLGWRLDRKAKRTYVDLNLTVRRDTALADQISQLRDQTTQFGGFLLEDGALKANWLGQLPAEDAQAYAALVDAVRDKAIADIEAENIAAGEKAIRRQLVEQFFQVLRDTAASGRSDGALGLRIAGHRITLVTGSYVADGQRLESVLKPIGQFLQQAHPAFSTLRLDAEQSDGVNFHTLSLPPPPGNEREKFLKMFGERLDIVYGFGKEAVYFAAGSEALPTLRQAIRRSQPPAPPDSPFQITLSVKQVADFVADMGKGHDQATAREISQVLESVPGSAELRLTTRVRRRGITLRLEAQEGILQWLARVHPETAKLFLESGVRSPESGVWRKKVTN